MSAAENEEEEQEAIAALYEVVEELRITKLELERAAQEKMHLIMRLAKAEVGWRHALVHLQTFAPNPRPYSPWNLWKPEP